MTYGRRNVTMPSQSDPCCSKPITRLVQLYEANNGRNSLSVLLFYCYHYSTPHPYDTLKYHETWSPFDPNPRTHTTSTDNLWVCPSHAKWMGLVWERSLKMAICHGWRWVACMPTQPSVPPTTNILQGRPITAQVCYARYAGLLLWHKLGRCSLNPLIK